MYTVVVNITMTKNIYNKKWQNVFSALTTTYMRSYYERMANLSPMYSPFSSGLVSDRQTDRQTTLLIPLGGSLWEIEISISRVELLFKWWYDWAHTVLILLAVADVL